MAQAKQGKLLKAPRKKTAKTVSDSSIFTPGGIKKLVEESIKNSTGIARVSAVKLAKEIVDEEPPDPKADIPIAWVPLRFVDGEFLACLEEARRIA